MKSDRVKKILMVVLLAVAGYIWWGNLGLFSSSGEQYAVLRSEISRDPAPSADDQEQIAFVEPRINPFEKSIRKEDAPISERAKPTRERPQASSPRPSSTSTLKGLIGEKNSPQAVIVLNNNTSAILSVNDSLDTWILSEIKDNFVIFKREKDRDTLWLYSTKP